VARRCAAQVHARNKPIDRSGSAEHEEDALLHKVAELTIGYSGAELANLLNESAILAVRQLSCDMAWTSTVRGQPGLLYPCYERS
jgi:ATP-dependent Zn protease